MIFLGTSASTLCPEEGSCYCQLYGLCLDQDLGDGTTKSVEADLSELRDIEEMKYDRRLARDLLKDRLKHAGPDEVNEMKTRLLSLEEEVQSIEQSFDRIVTHAIEDRSKELGVSRCDN